MMRPVLFCAALVGLLAAVVLGTDPGRHWLRGLKAEIETRAMVWRLPNITRRAGITVQMPDGVRLASDLYLPEGPGPFPTILVRTPYSKIRNGEVRHWVRLFAPEGYAVIIQDMRGRWASEGVFAPWPNAAPDGVATLDWIAAQDWSDGKVGTVGCSAHGEHQWPLAAERHPAHVAMVALGSGGAAGEIEDLWNFFGFWEGGIYTLAPGFGWFTQAGGKTPDKMAPVAINHAEGLATLPVRDAVRRYRPDPTDHDTLLNGFGQVGWGAAQGFLSGAERIGPAVLVGDTWFDHSVHGALALWRLAAETAPEALALIGPGTHCDFTGPFRSGWVADYPVAGSDYAPDAQYLAFMDRHLKGGPPHNLAPVQVYALGADQWEQHTAWPPKAARPHAVSMGPNGRLLPETAMVVPVDPDDPVPSLGGSLCCTGDPDAVAGPVDQRPIEGRDDLLVFTTAPLAAALDLAGPMEARLTVASDNEDADVVVRVTEVFPDGRSVLVQEGALRLRYRHGVAEPVPMTPNVAEEVRIRIRDVRRVIPAGNRLRVHVAGSSFPRLERPSGQMADPGEADTLLTNRLVLLAGVDRVSELVVWSANAPEFERPPD